MVRRNARVVPFLFVAALLAAPAAAQGFWGSIGFGHHGRRAHVQADYGHGGHYGHGGYGGGRHGGYDRCETRVFVPGCYETVAQQVWVPGRVSQVWCEAVYDTCYDACGRPYRRCVSQGYWKSVQSPGCYETRYVQVWREGYWTTRG